MDPRESADYIAGLAKDVFINLDKVPSLVEHLYEALEKNELSFISPQAHATFPSLDENDSVNCIFLYDTLNFCFWTKRGDEKWTVKHNGINYTGYFALCAAVGNAIKNNIKIYDPRVYTKFSLEEVKNIFKGDNNKEISLVEERLKCLKEVGEVLLEKYEGNFVNCIKKSEKSAKKLLEIIITDFPCFKDVATYHGKTVSFHKRAQILIGDIWNFYFGKGLGEFNDIDCITMFADYRIPQALVYFGVMSYSSNLKKKLDEDVIMKNGSPEEVEIRGCSIKVVELLKEELDKYMSGKKKYLCNSIMIDNYIWYLRRKEADKMHHVPFHKVLSIYY